MHCSTRLAAENFDPATEHREFEASLAGEGAVVTFVGLTRSHSTTGGQVTGLFLDHHPRLTILSLQEIAEDARQRFAVSNIRIVHRCGDIVPGEAIVFVAAAALHRRAAFEAVEYAIDRLKTEAVCWKREDSIDGPRWIEPTIYDRVDRARWSAE